MPPWDRRSAAAATTRSLARSEPRPGLSIPGHDLTRARPAGRGRLHPGGTDRGRPGDRRAAGHRRAELPGFTHPRPGCGGQVVAEDHRHRGPQPGIALRGECRRPHPRRARPRLQRRCVDGPEAGVGGRLDGHPAPGQPQRLGYLLVGMAGSGWAPPRQGTGNHHRLRRQRGRHDRERRRGRRGQRQRHDPLRRRQRAARRRVGRAADRAHRPPRPRSRRRLPRVRRHRPRRPPRHPP